MIDFKLILTIFFSIITVLLGILLTVKGIPYNQVITNIHKFASLLAGAGILLIIINLLKQTDIDFIKYLFIILTGIFYILSIISGGLIIGLKYANRLLFTHRIIPFISVIFSVITIFLLKK